MAILDLLQRINKRQPAQSHPIFEKDISIRRSFLLGLAMQAHADGILTAEEKQLFHQVAIAFEIEEHMAEQLLVDARNPSEERLNQLRQNLIHNKLKYYFIIDLHIMARQDHQIARVETLVIEQFAKMLDVDQEEMGFLTELADAVLSNDPNDRELWIQSFLKRLPGGQNLHPNDFDHYAPEAK